MIGWWAVPLALVWTAGQRGAVPAWALGLALAAWAGARFGRRGVLWPVLAVAAGAGGAWLAGGTVAPRAAAAPPAAERAAYVAADVVGRRLDTAGERVRLRLAPRAGPPDLPTCMQGSLPAAGAPPLGAAAWFRARWTPGESCPWARLAAEPAWAGPPAGAAAPSTTEARLATALRDVWTRGRVFDRRTANEPEVRRLRAVGLGHLLAISGLHTATVFALAYLLAGGFLALLPWRWLRRWRAGGVRLLRLAAALTAMWAYVRLAGAPPSALRAGAMWTAVAMTAGVARRAVPWDLGLALAATALAAAAPAAVATLSFRLSMTAVTFLVVLRVVPGRWRWIAGPVLPWLGTAPYGAALDGVTAVAPMANALGVPLFAAWVFPAALGAAVAEAVGWGGAQRLASDAFGYGWYVLATWSGWWAPWAGDVRWSGVAAPSAAFAVLWAVLPLVVVASAERWRRPAG